MGAPRTQMRKKFCQGGLEEGTTGKIRERAVIAAFFSPLPNPR